MPDLHPYLVGVELVGPTLLADATPDQCERWLPPIATRARRSGASSSPSPAPDRISRACSTRARADGDVWRVSGQKVWTSRGAYSRYGLLLARHDSAVPKHQGITAFGLDLHTAGVDVRPLRQMNGDAHFTEVFLDDIVVPDTDRIGAVGEGWRVALTCLSFERGAAAGGGSGGLLDVDRLVALAHCARMSLRSDVRDAARAGRSSTSASMSLTPAGRATPWAPASPGPKVPGSNSAAAGPSATTPTSRSVSSAPDALIAPPEPWHTLFLTAPSFSIRGGTDEIQRNIVGERVLGLPEEPRLDRALPFDQLPR